MPEPQSEIEKKEEARKTVLLYVICLHGNKNMHSVKHIDVKETII